VQLLQAGQHLAGVAQQRLARRREGNAARLALEQGGCSASSSRRRRWLADDGARNARAAPR